MPADDQRTTAQGLFTSAEAYLGAAERLLEGPTRPLWQMPVRFLLYHAAELYLKAYLRLAGVPLRRIERKGHSFSKLAEGVARRGLRLDPQLAEILRYAQDTEDMINSRYIRTGARVSVSEPDLRDAVRQLRRTIVESPLRSGAIVVWGEGVRAPPAHEVAQGEQR